MRTYRHLSVTSNYRQKLLQAFKDFSTVPRILDAMQAGQLERYFIDILRKAFGDVGDNTHPIAACVLPILYNYCRLSPTRQYEASKAGLVPLLVQTRVQEPTLKEFVLPTLCSLAHNSKCRVYLWTANAFPTLLRLVVEPGYEATGMAAIAAWTDGEPTKAIKAIVAQDGLTLFCLAIETTRAEAYSGVVSALNSLLERHEYLRRSIPALKLFTAITTQLNVKLLAGPSLIRTLQVILRVLEAQPRASHELSATGLRGAVQHLTDDMPTLAQNLAYQIFNY